MTDLLIAGAGLAGFALGYLVAALPIAWQEKRILKQIQREAAR